MDTQLPKVKWSKTSRENSLTANPDHIFHEQCWRKQKAKRSWMAGFQRRSLGVWWLRAGEMARRLRALATPSKDWIQFPHTTICINIPLKIKITGCYPPCDSSWDVPISPTRQEKWPSRDSRDSGTPECVSCSIICKSFFCLFKFMACYGAGVVGTLLSQSVLYFPLMSTGLYP